MKKVPPHPAVLDRYLHTYKSALHCKLQAAGLHSSEFSLMHLMHKPNSTSTAVDLDCLRPVQVAQILKRLR